VRGVERCNLDMHELRASAYLLRLLPIRTVDRSKDAPLLFRKTIIGGRWTASRLRQPIVGLRRRSELRNELPGEAVQMLRLHSAQAKSKRTCPALRDRIVLHVQLV